MILEQQILLSVKKSFGTDIASIFFSYFFLTDGELRLKQIEFSLFFYPNSKSRRNIVGGTSKIRKRYPTIINAHTNPNTPNQKCISLSSYMLHYLILIMIIAPQFTIIYFYIPMHRTIRVYYFIKDC